MDSPVYRQISRLGQELIAEIARYSVADLHEALGPVAGRPALTSPRMRPVGQGQRIVGHAVTACNYPGDNLMMHAALHVAQSGDVLVLVNGGTPHGALFGDIAATAAHVKGLAGAVVDGPVRDSDSLREMRFPVWSTSLSVSHPGKRGPGAVNVPVVCDGARVQPGDVVVADDDGVLVIPQALALGAVTRAKARAEGESVIKERLRCGESLFDILGSQALMDAAGVRFIDSAWNRVG